MSDLLSEAELDVLLSQLIEQTHPDRPTDEAAHAVVRWAERVRIGQQMLEMVLNGDARVMVRADGEPSYHLTPQGMASAEQMIATSKSASDMHARLVASRVGKVAVPEPEGKQ